MENGFDKNLLKSKNQRWRMFFYKKEDRVKKYRVHDYTRTIHFGVIPYILYGNVACGNAKGMWLASGVHLRKNLA